LLSLDSFIKSSIDLSLNFRNVDPDDLSAIFKLVSTERHPVFLFTHGTAVDPEDASIQYMRNHRRYEVKKGRMRPRHQRSAATSSGNTAQLPNIDSDNEEQDEDEENEES
jgi:hypothetical protein